MTRLREKKPRPRYNGNKSVLSVLMRNKGVSNADLARYMAVNQRTIVKWYNNPFALTLRQLTQISGLLNCPVEFLVYCITINSAHPENQEKATTLMQEASIKFNIPLI